MPTVLAASFDKALNLSSGSCPSLGNLHVRLAAEVSCQRLAHIPAFCQPRIGCSLDQTAAHLCGTDEDNVSRQFLDKEDQVQHGQLAIPAHHVQLQRIDLGSCHVQDQGLLDARAPAKGAVAVTIGASVELRQPVLQAACVVLSGLAGCWCARHRCQCWSLSCEACRAEAVLLTAS